MKSLKAHSYKHGHELLQIEWFPLRHRLTGSDGTLQSYVVDK